MKKRHSVLQLFYPYNDTKPFTYVWLVQVSSSFVVPDTTPFSHHMEEDEAISVFGIAIYALLWLIFGLETSKHPPGVLELMT